MLSMTTPGISEDALRAQEECFARAFAARDPALARDLYAPDVVYISPTVRLFDWPDRIDGIERTLEFIALTIRGCDDIRYEASELAVTAGADAAFVRVQFDSAQRAERLRSSRPGPQPDCAALARGVEELPYSFGFRLGLDQGTENKLRDNLGIGFVAVDLKLHRLLPFILSYAPGFGPNESIVCHSV